MEVFTALADPLLSEAQVADILGIKPGTLQVWRSTRRQQIDFVKVGGRVRYRRSAVEAYLQRRSVVAA